MTTPRRARAARLAEAAQKRQDGASGAALSASPPSALGGKAGGAPDVPSLIERSRGLSERLVVDLCASFLGEGDPSKVRDAVDALHYGAKHYVSVRARMRAADLLLKHAAKAAELGAGDSGQSGPLELVLHIDTPPVVGRPRPVLDVEAEGVPRGPRRRPRTDPAL